MKVSVCPKCKQEKFRIIQSGAVTAIGQCSNCQYREPMQITESGFVRTSVIWSKQKEQMKGKSK